MIRQAVSGLMVVAVVGISAGDVRAQSVRSDALQATQSEEAAFVRYYDRAMVEKGYGFFVADESTIDSGRRACRALDNGVTLNEIGAIYWQAMDENNVPMRNRPALQYHVATMVASAVLAMCPRHSAVLMQN